MLERHYQIDMNYHKARQRELFQAVQQGELLENTQPSDLHFKERLLNAAGNALIALGQKMRGETYSHELSEECA